MSDAGYRNPRNAGRCDARASATTSPCPSSPNRYAITRSYPDTSFSPSTASSQSSAALAACRSGPSTDWTRESAGRWSIVESKGSMSTQTNRPDRKARNCSDRSCAPTPSTASLASVPSRSASPNNSRHTDRPSSASSVQPSAACGVWGRNARRFALACVTTPSTIRAASSAPCGWIAPGVWMGSVAQSAWSEAMVARSSVVVIVMPSGFSLLIRRSYAAGGGRSVPCRT